MTEAKIRHLEMIRHAIDGASGNSLRIKGFAMLLLAGALALTLREGASAIPFPVGIILLVIIGFLGLLDYYFLREADLYRILYKAIMTRSQGNIDFSMETMQHINELDTLYKELTPFPVLATIILHGSIAIVVIFGTLPSVWTNG